MYKLKIIEVLPNNNYLLKVRILSEDIELFCQKYAINEREINLTSDYLEVEVNQKNLYKC